jgi:hypothetical protein
MEILKYEAIVLPLLAQYGLQCPIVVRLTIRTESCSLPCGCNDIHTFKSWEIYPQSRYVTAVGEEAWADWASSMNAAHHEGLATDVPNTIQIKNMYERV